MKTIKLDGYPHVYDPIQPKEIVNIVVNGELKGQFIGVDTKVRKCSCSLCALNEYDIRCWSLSGEFICGECAGLDPLDTIMEDL